MKTNKFSKTGLAFSLVPLLSATLFSGITLADEKDVTHGYVNQKLDGMTVNAGATISAFATDLKNTNDELTASFDMISTLPSQSGQWLVYVEGNTSPRMDGVSEMLPEVNADVGSALDRDGKGRFQVSELHYSWSSTFGTLTTGLMDSAGFLDASDIANDETRQFSSGSFVNNPVIALPDYTLGVAYHRDNEAETMGITGLLVSSHGLADNKNASYSELFKLSEDEKGAFIALEGYWKTGALISRVGLWTSTADNIELVDSNQVQNNYGVYAVVDGTTSHFNWNIRAGLANDEVSSAARFLSAAVEVPTGENTFGVAIGQTWVSSEIKSDGIIENTQQLEVYYRLTINNNFELTPDIQYIKNSEFNAAQDSAIVYGVRLGWAF